MTPFLWKRCFLTWLKKWVLLTVFWKSCVSWKHYFYSVFSKTQFFKNKNCMLKKTENLWKIVGCFWTWQNGVFFEVLILKGLFLVCLVLFQVLKMLVFFPIFWVFLATSLGPKPSLFYVFLFFCFPLFCFIVCLFFIFCLFFGGFKGQVRWPKGPPHLALNPPYFICFCFFFFVFFVVLFFLVFASARQGKPLFSPLKRAFLCTFSVSPFVSL